MNQAAVNRRREMSTGYWTENRNYDLLSAKLDFWSLGHNCWWYVLVVGVRPSISL
jgi:hypothetical protein